MPRGEWVVAFLMALVIVLVFAAFWTRMDSLAFLALGLLVLVALLVLPLAWALMPVDESAGSFR